MSLSANANLIGKNNVLIVIRQLIEERAAYRHENTKTKTSIASANRAGRMPWANRKKSM